MKFVRILSLLLIAFLSLTLVACGDDEDKEGAEILDDLERDENGNFTVEYLENITLNLWSVIGDPDKSTLDRMILRFNTEYQGMVRVNVTTVGHNDYYPALTNSYVNDYKNVPDMCLKHIQYSFHYALNTYLGNFYSR